MRCELVASLLHAPEILFLDEPTIGLDVTAKAVIRDLIREQSEREGRTLLFTSHDTGDMETVCERVIVIHQGRILLDQSVESLRRGYIGRKRITVHSAQEHLSLELPGVRVRSRRPHCTELDVDLAQTRIETVVHEVLRVTRLNDLAIEDPPMDEIVQAIYSDADSGGCRGDLVTAATHVERRGGLARYLWISHTALRQAFSERAAFLGRLAFYAVILLIFSRLWLVLEERGVLPGLGASELLWYLAITEWVMLSLPPLFLDIEEDVRSGEIAYRLSRPLSYLGSRLAEAAGDTALRAATLAPWGCLLAWLLSGGLPEDPRGLLIALPLGALGIAFGLLTMAAIGLAAFWLHDCSPAYWLWQKFAFILGGLLIPLDVYPEWLREFALWTPFAAMMYGPGSMAFGWDPAAALSIGLALLAWTALTLVVLVVLYRVALRVLDVNGG